MGSGLVKCPNDNVVSDRNGDVSARKTVPWHISVVARLSGGFPTTEEAAEHRNNVCRQSWQDIRNTSHVLASGESIHGSDLFCRVFLSSLCAHDRESNGKTSLYELFKPLPKSHNLTRSSILKRIVRYLLSIHSESRNVKHHLRALGRTHARIKIWRTEFDLFAAAFMETIVSFPVVVLLNGEILTAWMSLLKFAINQMCFDEINFVDHCTLSPPPNQNEDINLEDDVEALQRSTKTTSRSMSTTATSSDSSCKRYQCGSKDGEDGDGKLLSSRVISLRVVNHSPDDELVDMEA